LQIEVGAVSTSYAPYQYGLATTDLNDKAVTREKLSNDVANTIGKKRVHIGTGQEYTSILAAMKANSGKNVEFVVHSGVYDLVAEYIAHYSSNYFVDYAGYQTSEVFD
jgi:hypothetical protein